MSIKIIVSCRLLKRIKFVLVKNEGFSKKTGYIRYKAYYRPNKI